MAAASRTPYDPAHDLHAVLDLLLDVRLATRTDRYPTLPRLELLLTSRLWNPADDACIWRDADGRLIAFAGLFRRRPDAGGVGLTRVVRPTARQIALDAAILDWATARAGTLARERGASIALDAEQEEHSSEWVSLLAQHGFTPAGEGDVYLACPLDGDLPDAVLPDGYVVRPLADEHELDTYTALYGFAPMNAAHRRALLHRPDYLHLVAVAPDGALAAYCECSYTRAEWERGAPRIAWVDYIGTAEAHQRRGLGRAVLLAGLRQMRTWGAETAMLVTMASNTTAQSLYTAAGFHIAAAVRSYVARVSPA